MEKEYQDFTFNYV